MHSKRTQSSQGARYGVGSSSVDLYSSVSNTSNYPIPLVPQAPYSIPTRAQTAHRLVDKSSLVWRDFLDGVKRRKRALNKLREVTVNESTTSGLLKRLLLEIRQMTLKVIEDALEIEYRSQINNATHSNNANKNTKVYPKINQGNIMQLPPISSFRGMDEKEDVYALAAIINEMDDICKLPVIAVFLPMDFPKSRNPFLLGKTVDELTFLVPPIPESGNLEEELKVLELLRYKRASKALLKAEAQVLNKLPIALYEVEKVFTRMIEDLNLEKLIRAVCVFLDNDKPNHGQAPELQYLTNVIQIDPHELLTRINNFKGNQAMRVDVQAAVRTLLRDCRFEYLHDSASVFLIEWCNSILSRKPPVNATDEWGINRNSFPDSDSYIGGGSISNNSKYNNSNNVFSVHKGAKFLEDDTVSVGSWNNTINNTTTNKEITIAGALASKNRMLPSPNPHGDLVSVIPDNNRPSWEDENINSPSRYNGNTNAAITSNIDSNSNTDNKQHEVAMQLTNNACSNNVTINDGGGVQLKPKKSKSKANSSPEMKRIIREEVSKAISEQALARRATLGGDDNIGLGTEEETLSSVRYELVKLQQELLRRKVLDPRHYNAKSVDTITAMSQGLTTDAPDNRADSKAKDSQVKYVAIADRGFGTKDGQATIEFVWDVTHDVIIGNIYRYYDINADGDVITEHLRRIGSISVRQEKELVAWSRVSKIIFNRILDHTLEQVLEEANASRRVNMMESMFDQLQSKALDVPPSLGEILIRADRVLYKKPVMGEGAVAELAIARNNECTGLLVTITPPSTSNMGPIKMVISDNELQVLLLNQRSLFMLAQSKWACMQMISQWLATRVNLRKIRLTDSMSQSTLLGNDSSSSSSSSSDKGINFLIDVTIDRHIDIGIDPIEQWRSRNVPSISNLRVELTATQELDMLRFDVQVKVPNPNYSEDNEYVDDVGDDDNGSYHSTIDIKSQYFIIPLQYRLTCAELNVFGVADTKGERKIALNGTSGDNHPSAFMWNILSRMHIDFRGSVSKPFSRSGYQADDAGSWSIRYDRRLFRDIRTISGGVLIITATAVGNELLYEAEPTEGSIYKKVGSKLMEESDISDMVKGEGWPLNLLDYSQRGHLAYRVLEKLKVICEKGLYYLQPHNYAETRMLELCLTTGNNHKDINLGGIEINNFHTLSDLRTIIRHEIDRDMIPRQYRFFYKGTPCSVRQESFRRAWECLPKVLIINKVIKTDESMAGAGGALSKKEKEDARLRAEAEKKEQMKLIDGQRRVGKKLIPIPVYTLAYVREGSNEVYLLHDSRDLFVAGDVIRIGNSQSRDYIVALQSRAVQNAYPKQIRIDPPYDLLCEDYSKPTCGNYPYPTHSGYVNNRMILETPQMLGYRFDIPTLPGDADGDADGTTAAATAGDGDGEVKVVASTAMKDSNQVALAKLSTLTRNDASEVKLAVQRIEDSDESIWKEVWVWKCIPPDDDKRPKWRKKYDDGQIKYQYQYPQDSTDGVTHFKVMAYYKYLEILTTDARVPSFTRYSQRVISMQTLSIDYYTRTAFNAMCNWFPQYAKGIESIKFMKLMRDSKIFPDIKKAARIAQLDMIFGKEVRGEHGIVDKYIDYTGFTRALQEVALKRYPPPRADGDGDGDGDDLSSIGRSRTGNDDDGSIGNSSSISSGSRSRISASVSRSAKGGKAITKAKPSYLNAKSSTSSRGRRGAGANKADDNDPTVNVQSVIDPEYAAAVYRQLVTDYIMNIDEWSDIFWRTAKVHSMDKEAVLYCAATRITAWTRNHIAHYKYTFYRQQMILFQAQVRRKLTRIRMSKYIKVLLEDWLYRLRYHAATTIGSVIRMYLTRCWNYRIMKRLKEQQVAVQKARRLRLKRIRNQVKKGIVYKETKRINGISALLTIWRNDSKAYSRDYGIIIQIYIPISQMTYKFPVVEKELRYYMSKETNIDALSANDLLDKRYLQMVVGARLIIRKSMRLGQAPQVIFSRQALGQRGGKALVHGKIISGEHFVCTVYATGSDIAVQAYHRISCNVFRAAITIIELHDWVTQSYRDKCIDELDRDKRPSILHPNNVKQLYMWAINNMIVDTRKGTFKVLFACQLRKSRKLQMVVVLQAFVRYIVARKRVVQLLDSTILKVKVSPKDVHNIYYVNVRTGISQWDKPKLLMKSDLATKMINKWYPITYIHEGQSYEHYVNPYNGRYTHHSVNRAACIIQSLIRNHLLKLIMLPRDVIHSVVPLVRDAVTVYQKSPNQLRCVVNAALCTHVVLLDEVLGKKLYIDCLELSESSPLVSRAFALYLLGTCEAPVQLAREKALRWLADAKRRDNNHTKFKIAYDIYRYSVLKSPRVSQAIVNLAIVELLVYGNKSRGEKLMRRAIAIDPFNPRVIELWSFLKDEFPERQLLYNPASQEEQISTEKRGGKKRVVHGRPVIEDPAWAGWCYVTEDPYKVTQIRGPYWYNPVNGKERTVIPHFDKEWEIRKQRSRHDGERHGLEHYYDPLTSCHFQYHVMSNTYQ